MLAVLDQGEVYSSYFSVDGSGKHISANRPVACFVTTPHAYVQLDVNQPSSNSLYQQLYGESLWGNRFFVPVTIRGIESVRVIASQDNTIISFTDGTLIRGSQTLNAGEWAEIKITAVQHGCYIESNHPVGVASYLVSGMYPGLSYSHGNPAMVWIPPVEQFINETLVAPFPSIDMLGFVEFSEQHVIIVAPTLSKNQTEMKQGDGVYEALMGGEWHDHPSGYSYYTLPIENNPDVSYGFKNPEWMMVFGYGLGNQTLLSDDASYYYIASEVYKPELYFEVNGIHYKSFEGEALCDGTIEVEAVKFPANHTPGHLRWLIDGEEQTAFTDSLRWTGHLPAGEHTILMISKGKYVEIDSLSTSFVIGEPKETTINDTVCQNNPYFFKGEYLNVSGIYRDTLPTVYGCDSIIILDLTVYPPPDTLRLPEAIRYVDEGYYENGFNIAPQYSTGTLSDTLFLGNRSGCDSVVILNLKVLCREKETSLNVSVCQNDPYFFKGEYLNTTGIYSDTLPTMYGCDSIIIIDLTVKPLYEAEFAARIPINEPYNAHGFFVPPAPAPGLFTFEQTLHDTEGCDSVSLTLHLTVYAEIIPDTYFSPNGDGVNDRWNIKHIEYFEVVSVEIYDRYGRSIVHYAGHFTPWDGTYQGQPMPSTDYWYVITLEEKEKIYIGHFTLSR